jgi:phage head maturation protease
MKRELKIAPTPIHVKTVNGRTVTGIFSVFGNVDSYGDKLHPGCFAKTITERGQHVVHLWMHDFGAPPIAIVQELRELPRQALPPELLAAYPDAMGACEVTRTYLDTPRANEVLSAIVAGSPLQMSFAFEAIKYDYEEPSESESAQGPYGQSWPIRNVREVKLYETSDVIWGANSATTASKADVPVLLRELKGLLTQLKAGSRHSAADVALLNEIHRAAVELGCTECKGRLDPDMPDDDDKSRAAHQALTLRARWLTQALTLQETSQS